MASEAAIAAVRDNINEPTDQKFSDEKIGATVDAEGSVDAASAALWREKAASYAELVDVTEAGASRKMGDLHKQALEMATSFDTQASQAAAAVRGRTRVRKIERS